MSRNSSGNYALPAGNPVVSGTTITTSWANNTLNDIASEVTDSLSRSGKGAMLAALELADGTVAAPALSFDTDPDCGLYRGGANDLRMGVNTTRVQTWNTSGSTFNEPLASEKGYTATQSTSNSAAITCTGNGSGDGMVATGGATGDGVTGNGGATSGNGVVGAGTGGGHGVVGTGQAAGFGVLGTGGGTNAAGVRGVGGATNGAGGSFLGTGSGAGVSSTGGGSSGAGGTFTGGASNGTGVICQGDGTGAGVSSTGGDSNGIGVYGQGGTTNGTGVQGQGTGTGVGVLGAGGTTGAGGSFSHGTAATAGTRQTAITVGNGDIDFSGVTDPSSTTAHSDKLGPANIIKAWAKVSVSGGTATVDGGFNITSATRSGSDVNIAFASNFANANYVCVVSVEIPAGSDFIAQVGTVAVGSVNVHIWDVSTANKHDISTLAAKFHVICVGLQ